MRKDAKIGFAIGGVLLAVLTVYAIVVPKHKKSNSTVSLVTPVPPAVDVSSQQPPASMIATGDGAGNPAVSNAAPANPAPVPSPVPAKDTATPLVQHTDGVPTGIADSGAAAVGSRDAIKPDDLKLEKPADLIVDRAPGTIVDAPVTAHVKPSKPKTLQMDVADGSAPSSSDRVYVVQSGQTLSSIASDIYGNPRFWVAIQRENRSINANRLKVGEKINLPDINPLRPNTVEETAAEVEVPTSMRLVIPGAHTTARSYEVKAGDSIYKIARTVLGTGRKAESLYALNRDVIGPDKARLRLGMVLKLPEPTAGLAQTVR